MADSPESFTPTEVAKRRNVDIRIVLAAIASGQLTAINWASPGSTRPRWRITAQALADYEAARSSRPQIQIQRQRRQRHDTRVLQFV